MKKQLLIFVIILFYISTVFGQANKLEFISRVGYCTPAQIDVSGNYLYVNAVNGFVIMDITDKENPIEVSNVVQPDPANRAWYFAIYNDTAYCTWGNSGGIGFIDVKNKSNPIVDSKIFFPEYDYSDLYLQYPLLFAFAKHRITNKVYLHCVDISNPSAFVLKESLDVLLGFQHSAFEQKKFIVDNNYLYLAMGPPNRIIDTAELHIFEITSLNKLVHTGSVYLGKSRHELVLDKKGNYIYVAGIFTEPKSDIKIVNVTKPKLPFLTKSWNESTFTIANIDISGDYIFLTETELGGADENFHVISLSNDDTTLTVCGSTKLPIANKNFNIKVIDNYAFINHWDYYAIHTVDINIPCAPVVIDTIPFGHAWRDVSVQNNKIYASIFDYYQLYTIDAASATNPKIINRSMPIGWGWGVEAKGNYLYMALGSQHDTTKICGGLAVFDISNPDNPIQRGQIMAHPSNEDVQVDVDTAEKRAYVIAGDPIPPVSGSISPGLRIVDVSDPDSLVELSSINLSIQCNGIHKVGNLAYIAASDTNASALYIVDVSNPLAPDNIGKWTPSTRRSLNSVFVKDNIAYLTFGITLTMLNVSDPSNLPTNPPYFLLDAEAMDVRVKNNYCFVLTTRSLWVFDITTPMQPIFIDKIAVFNEESRHFDISGELIYVSAIGIYIYRFSPSTSVSESDVLPNNFMVYQNYPNPFNPATAIRFSVPRREHVTLKVFDVLGREVSTLVDEIKEVGVHNSTFSIRQLTKNSKLSSGTPAKGGYTSGVYFYQLRAGSYVETKKMILIK